MNRRNSIACGFILLAFQILLGSCGSVSVAKKRYGHGFTVSWYKGQELYKAEKKLDKINEEVIAMTTPFMREEWQDTFVLKGNVGESKPLSDNSPVFVLKDSFPTDSIRLPVVTEEEIPELPNQVYEGFSVGGVALTFLSFFFLFNSFFWIGITMISLGLILGIVGWLRMKKNPEKYVNKKAPSFTIVLAGGTLVLIGWTILSVLILFRMGLLKLSVSIPLFF